MKQGYKFCFTQQLFGEEAVIVRLQVDKVKAIIMIYQPPGAQIFFYAPSLPVSENQFQFQITPRSVGFISCPCSHSKLR